MKYSRWRATVFCTFFLVISGCGLATSNEERIARAEEQIELGEYRAAMIELKNVLGSETNNPRARLLLAKVTIGLGDILDAEKELVRAAELGVAESEIRPLHLQILAAQGRYADMLASLGLAPDGLTDAQVFKFRGQALLGIGNAEVALQNYEEWLAVEPDSVDARVGAANATAVLGDVRGAIETLVDVVDGHPNKVDAWHALGAMHFQQGSLEAAERALSRAADVSRPQENIIRYAAILSGLVETQLVLDLNEDARRNLRRLRGILPESPVSLLLGARLARADGDYALAARELQSLLNISPNNTQAQLFLANVQMMQGNFAQAESLLSRIVAAMPANIQARKLLAQVQLRQSRPQGAVEALAPLLDGAEGDADLYSLLAYASLQQGDDATAIERFKVAVDLDASDMQARLNLAAAYISADEPGLAIEVLNQVPVDAAAGYRRERLLMLALNSSGQAAAADAIAGDLVESHGADPQAVILVADYYYRSGRVGEARQALANFLADGSRDASILNALGRVELGSGNTTAAKSLFEEVRAGNTTDLSALLGLARIAEMAGETDTKLELLESAARADETALVPRAWLARSYVRSGRNEDAERVADELLAIGFESAQIAHIVGITLIENGRAGEALRQFQRAVATSPDSANILLSLAQTYLILDRTVDARESLNEALQRNPDWPPAMTMLALIELRQGQVDDAVRLVTALRRAHPDNVGAMVLEGEVRYYQQDYAAAAQAFDRAVRSGAGRSAVLRAHQAHVDGNLNGAELPLVRWLDGNPADAVARSFLAQHYQRSSNNAAAISEYERVISETPDNPAVLNNLAWLHHEAGNLERAVTLAEKAWELDRSSGSIADTLAWIYRDLGQLDESRQMLDDASRLSPDNGEIQFHRAIVLAETGNEDDARLVLEALIEADTAFPSRTQAEEFLAGL